MLVFFLSFNMSVNWWQSIAPADQQSGGLESSDSSALRQLLTHVPDVVINCDHKKAMPRVKHVVGVCMFADISGEVKRLKIAVLIQYKASFVYVGVLWALISINLLR